MRLCLLITAMGFVVSSGAAPLNTQIPPFTNSGVTRLATSLSPQTGPVLGPASYAAVDFGFNDTDAATRVLDVGITSAAIGATWGAFPTAAGSATSINGELTAFGSVSGAIPTGVDGVQVHSSAGFRDALTITSTTIPSGQFAYLHVFLIVTGDLLCDAPLCPTGLAFGYSPGTLGRSEYLHQIGGEAPTPTAGFATTQELVPLPFLMGQPFNIALNIDTSPRLTRWAGNSTATSDFTHTVSIGAISLTDANGNGISGWSIDSASGLVYSESGVSAVPEASSFLLLGTGVLSLCLAKFRQRQIRR